MNSCRFCGNELTENGDFCDDCGFIKLNEGESPYKGLIKQFKYLFINPVAFIRTSRITNPFFTGAEAILIILIDLLIMVGMGNKLQLGVSVKYSLLLILGTFGMLAVEALVMFLIADIGFKNKIGFMAYFNLCITVQLILLIISFIGAILGVCISPCVYLAISLFGSILSLLLLYQGVKDLVQSSIKIHLITIIGSLGVTSFIVYLALRTIIIEYIQSYINGIVSSIIMGGFLWK